MIFLAKYKNNNEFIVILYEDTSIYNPLNISDIEEIK